MRILLIEDDPRLSNILAHTLKNKNYIVDIAKETEEAKAYLDIIPYDLLLLDIGLPKIDGITLCRQLRQKGYNLPIILITGKDDRTEKIEGLNAGADDYLIKPFDWEELFARIRAALRRKNTEIMKELSWDKLFLIPDTGTVTYDTQSLNLTPTEYKILELFLRNKERVFNTDGLIDNLWELEPVPSESTIRSHIKGLRKKLKTAGAPNDFIETVYGLGYRLNNKLQSTKNLKDESETREEEGLKALEEEEQTLQEKLDSQTLKVLKKYWYNFKDSILEDLDFLEEESNKNKFDPQENRETIRVAHKLVGLLGSFGLTESSTIARQIENNFQAGILENTKKYLEEIRIIVNNHLIENQPKSQDNQKDSKEVKQEEYRLLIIDNDLEVIAKITEIGEELNLKVEKAIDKISATKIIQTWKPDLIILELYCFEKSHQLLAEIGKEIPVVVLTKSQDLEDRVEAARNNAIAYLQKPFIKEQITNIIQQTLVNYQPGKVLVVDDDLKFLELLKQILEQENLEVITLSQPKEFWKTLKEVSPEILILDRLMPELDGIDLCRIVRNDPRWHQLSIIFISAYINESDINVLVAAGADDFVSKSKIKLELPSRVISHLQRVRRLRQLQNQNLYHQNSQIFIQ